MRIISIKKLKDFWLMHNQAEQPIKAWYAIFRHNNFYTSKNIKLLFPSCSFIESNRVIFNIAGNKYRLIVYMRYDIQITYIRFIGTHSQYDKIDAKTI